MQTTSLKVDELSVMAHATDSFPLNEQEVQQVQVALSKMNEYEKNRPKNEVSQ